MAAYVFEIDWNNDGDFGDANENVSANLLAISYDRGRDKASPATGRAGPGSLKAIVLNPSGIYSPNNAASPLAGSLLANRMCRFRMTSPVASTRWTGYIKRIVPLAGSPPTAQIIAQDALGVIDQAKISPAPLPDGTVSDDVAEAILDAAGWSASKRVINAGSSLFSRWYEGETYALQALRRVEDTELGFIYTNEAGDIVYEGRQHRLTGARLTSQATFSDQAASGAVLRYLLDSQEQDPVDEIWNEAIARVRPFAVAGVAVLWTLTGETPVLQPGESRTWIATVASGVEYVETWTTPVVGTDITQTGAANGDIGVSVVKTATTMQITITNNHASAAATLTLAQARGAAVTAGSETLVTASDSASQAKYNKRSFPLPGVWLRNTNDAKDQVDYIVSQYAEPLPFLTLNMTANLDFTSHLALKISDRITVSANDRQTYFGISRDFFIERIEESIAWGPKNDTHNMRYLVSPAASAADGFWIVGTSQLGTGTRLGY